VTRRGRPAKRSAGEASSPAVEEAPAPKAAPTEPAEKPAEAAKSAKKEMPAPSGSLDDAIRMAIQKK